MMFGIKVSIGTTVIKSQDFQIRMLGSDLLQPGGALPKRFISQDLILIKSQTQGEFLTIKQSSASDK